MDTPLKLTPAERDAVEDFLRAFPWWPFNTRPFVRLGTWLLTPTIISARDRRAT